LKEARKQVNNLTNQLIGEKRIAQGHHNPRLGIPIFGSDSWDPHQKQNSNSICDSGNSGWIFFEIPISGKSDNWNSNL
jgi:hypothetical protein